MVSNAERKTTPVKLAEKTQGDEGLQNRQVNDKSDVEGTLRIATGVVLLRIEQIKFVDARPACGPLSMFVKGKIIESFGTVTDEFEIYVASAGNGPRDAPPEAKPILDPQHTAVGQEYWIVFDWSSGISFPVQAWAAESQNIREKIKELESEENFEWHPVGPVQQ